jgi:DNA-binding MarR family transcriptional regulator
MSLQAELRKKRPFDLPEQEAFLNIARTHGVLTARMARLFKEHEITPPQYNILRILRGAGADGLPCQEIGEQMVNQVPDVTRLVDRLEQAGLAERKRTEADRRVVLVRITAAGRKLLAGLDAPVLAMHKQVLGHLSRAELEQINRLMEKARGPAGEPKS